MIGLADMPTPATMLRELAELAERGEIQFQRFCVEKTAAGTVSATIVLIAATKDFT